LLKRREKEVMDKVHSFGIGISYDQFLQILSNMMKSACEYYEETGVVCRQRLHEDIFTTGTVDNNDHNPLSRTSIGSFHGTAVSHQQHAM
jgi:hypothetical protein